MLKSKKTLITRITSRDDKVRHAVNLFVIEYDKAKLDNDQAQRLNERDGEFKEGIADLIKRLVSNSYAGEEVESNFGYPLGYKLKSITEQINNLRELFPGIGYANKKLAEGDIPANAEGWFAIPRWEKIAPTYNEAIQVILDLIKKTRNNKFYNFCGQIGPKRLRQTSKTKKMFEEIGNEQKKHDILVIPAQFGLRHRGRSVRRAREVMNANEFAFGTFAIGIMLLTHPKRLRSFEELCIDCAGDEYSPNAKAIFSCAPLFNFCDSKVNFRTSFIEVMSKHYGSVSGIVPQS